MLIVVSLLWLFPVVVLFGRRVRSYPCARWIANVGVIILRHYVTLRWYKPIPMEQHERAKILCYSRFERLTLVWNASQRSWLTWWYISVDEWQLVWMLLVWGKDAFQGEIVRWLASFLFLLPLCVELVLSRAISEVMGELQRAAGAREAYYGIISARQCCGRAAHRWFLLKYGRAPSGEEH